MPAWPCELGLWTPTLQLRPSNWDDGLPRFGVAPPFGVMDSPCFSVAPRVGFMDSHASACPLKLGLRTPTLRCGPSNWDDGDPHFGGARRFWVMDAHALVWLLEWG